MQVTQEQADYTRYHITEQQVYEELIRMGMDKPIAIQFANKYFYNELTQRDLENLEKNFNVRLKALEDRIMGVENRISELKDDIKSLDTKIDNVKNELKDDIKNVKNELSVKIDSLEKNNKWIFGLTFTIWLTTLGGFIALFLK
ncbi:hypothetical protein DB313_05480 (plasmid) [Borrelia turcica IST7]|uniref:DUF1640 domain-containing protein n=1 Tax=Borrelia turcica IST7 TaxID=1104446 RepID=A0A386PQQ9_9SPIR|nr:Bdr family repetitive protein [Borrelia turcica]AYE36950.1 hypothetical protein DB313_05480 [Borrelia turcica IST7]